MSGAKKRPGRRSGPVVPTQVESTRELADLQRAMWSVVSQPLTADNRTKPRMRDGRLQQSRLPLAWS